MSKIRHGLALLAAVLMIALSGSGTAFAAGKLKVDAIKPYPASIKGYTKIGKKKFMDTMELFDAVTSASTRDLPGVVPRDVKCQDGATRDISSGAGCVTTNGTEICCDGFTFYQKCYNGEWSTTSAQGENCVTKSSGAGRVLEN